MKIYTKTGDTGETGLFGGPRVRKDCPRIEAYGTVDELNAVLGIARAEALTSDVDLLLARVQNELFELGAELSHPRPPGQENGHARRNEHRRAGNGHRPARSPPRAPQAIHPARRHRAAALLHLARTVCRRAERRLVTLAAAEPISPPLIIYLNRLSDLLFVLARAVNQAANRADVPWQKSP